MPITGLLPIRIDRKQSASDLERFASLGLPSMCRFLAPGLLKQLIIVASRKDAKIIKERLDCAIPFELAILDEDDICPNVSGQRGWYKQQILKLAAADFISTDWYLTLDADLICTRFIDERFLFPEGKAIWQRELASVHPDWWAGSRLVLHDGKHAALNGIVFGVTPALLHTASVKSLISRLSLLYRGSDWTVELLKNAHLDWTEYSLYWTHLSDSDTWRDLYSENCQGLYDLDSAWTPETAMKLSDTKLRSVFAHDSPWPFYVFQSRAGVPLSETIDLFRPYLDLPPTPLKLRVAHALHRLSAPAWRSAGNLKTLLRHISNKAS